jgi:hypothetical protein
MVQTRHFFHVSGFDPYDLAALHRRFVRETAVFAATWSVTAAVSALRDRARGASLRGTNAAEPAAQDSMAGDATAQDAAAQDAAAQNDGEGHWTVAASAPGWQVRACYEQLDWSDIVRAELGRPALRRLWDGAVTFADFIVSGTARRYFAANWRYGMFFLVPFLDVVLFAAIAIAAGFAVANATRSALGGLVGSLAGVLLAGTVFALMLRWPGERWRVHQGLADWIFARDYMLGRRPDMTARVEAFAARLIACARRGDADEIVIAGHSLGATIAIDALACALMRDPDLGRHGPSICILTIGATIPKLALHPKGEWLRAQVNRVAAEPSFAWAEYQARDDIISFHKFDPVRLRRFKDVNAPGGPVIRRVQIHEMLKPETLARIRFNFMRLHYQFVMANERRTAYDYFMLMCGPAPFRQTIEQPNGPADLHAADGSLRG